MNCPTTSLSVYVGNPVISTVVFTDPTTGTPVDPDTVEVVFGPKGGTATTLVYGTDGAVTKLSTGTYKGVLSVDTQTSGVAEWPGQWQGSGTYEAAIPFVIIVSVLPWPLAG